MRDAGGVAGFTGFAVAPGVDGAGGLDGVAVWAHTTPGSNKISAQTNIITQPINKKCDECDAATCVASIWARS